MFDKLRVVCGSDGFWDMLPPTIASTMYLLLYSILLIVYHLLFVFLIHSTASPRNMYDWLFLLKFDVLTKLWLAIIKYSSCISITSTMNFENFYAMFAIDLSNCTTMIIGSGILNFAETLPYLKKNSSDNLLMIFMTIFLTILDYESIHL